MDMRDICRLHYAHPPALNHQATHHADALSLSIEAGIDKPHFQLRTWHSRGLRKWTRLTASESSSNTTLRQEVGRSMQITSDRDTGLP